MAPKTGKRKRSGDGPGKKAKTATRPSDDPMCPEHVLKVLTWIFDCNQLYIFVKMMMFQVVTNFPIPRIRDVVTPKGGPDLYLQSKYKTQDTAVFNFLFQRSFC